MGHPLYCASRSGALHISSSRVVAVSIPLFLASSITVNDNIGSRFRLKPRTGVSALQYSVQHRRYASSHSSPSIKPERTTQNSRLNPPASTLPPILDAPTRKPDQSTLTYLFSLGRSYVRFYNDGVRAVWSNYKTSRRTLSTLPRSLSPDEALRQGKLDRGQWQLLRRSRADTRKIPAFALVLGVFGEFTPLLLPLIGGVIPRTCRIPRQVDNDRRKMEERRRQSFRRGDSVLDITELEGGREMGVASLRKEQILHVARSLGLYAKVWDTLWENAPVRLVVVPRVKKWVDYIKLDDGAIERFGGVEQLDPEELRLAAEERGIDMQGQNDKQVKELLDKWLVAVKEQSPLMLVLTRPNVWDRWIQRGQLEDE